MIKIIISILVMTTTLNAQEKGIELYTNCSKEATDCTEIKNTYKTLKLSLKPALILNRENILDVYRIPNEWGETALNFSLNKEASSQLKQVTKANIDKPLHIVFNGKLLSSPTIAAELSSGFVLSQGMGKKIDILEEAGWLKEMVNNRTSEKRNTRQKNLFWVVLITLSVISGVLFYAFRKTQSS